jgi:hypothetical protein
MKILKGIYDSAKILMKGALKKPFLDALVSRSFPIPELVLRKGLEYKLRESEARLMTLKCTEKGIDVEFSVQKLGAELVYSATLVFQSFELSGDKHEAVIRVEKSKLAGDKLWGKVVAWIAELVFDDILATAVSHTNLSKVFNYDSDTHLARIDFMTMPGVEKLYERHTVLLNQRIIDVVQIESCHHESGGIKLKLGTFLG